MLILAYQYFEQYEPAVLCDWQNYLVKRRLKSVKDSNGMLILKLVMIYHSEYLKMIQYKTAVLVAAMKMGALVAEASVENADLIYEFGLNLGLAFQLQDDYLDAFGNLETLESGR
jgi:geranylgeranyl diphosphate synthase type II